MKIDSGHTVVYVTKEEDDLQKQKFTAYGNGVIKLIPGNWYFPRQFENYANELYNFKFRKTDLLVMSYPKCGSTWTLEILWNMRNNPNLDHPMAITDTTYRTPFLELDFIMNSPTITALQIPEDVLIETTGSTDVQKYFFNVTQTLPDPRIIKTHLPFTLLQKNLIDICKVVFIMRNPKDVCVSYLHHHRLFTCHNYKGSTDEFVDFFVNNKLMYSPLWEIMKEAWGYRNHPNMYIIFYEKMKADTKSEIVRLNDFLGTNLNETQIDNVISHTSFENLKKISKEVSDPVGGAYMNTEIMDVDGGFFRKGISGDWKNKLNDAQSKRIDDLIKENMKSMGTEFKEISNY